MGITEREIGEGIFRWKPIGPHDVEPEDISAEILEVLRGRREQVESLQADLRGAVQDNDRLVCALVQAGARINEGDIAGARATITAAIDSPPAGGQYETCERCGGQVVDRARHGEGFCIPDAPPATDDSRLSEETT